MPELDWRAWTPRLARFYEALLRAQAAGRGSAHLVDLQQAVRYGLTADLATFTDDVDGALSKPELRLSVQHEAGPVEDALELRLSEMAADEGSGIADGDTNEDPTEPAMGPDPQAAATLRRIARKQRNDSYNRETLLGYPLIGVRVGRKRYSGPLLLWETEIEYDPRARQVRLRRRNSTPDLNTLLLSRLADDPDDISLVSETAMPLLLRDDFGPGRIPELLETLTGIFVPLSRMRDIDPRGSSLRDFLRELARLRDSEAALLSRRLVLTNGPRSHAFLLSDLREIAAQADPSGESVLAQIVGDVPTEGAPKVDPINLPFDDTADGGKPLWFPFPSNRSQRDVAQTATRVSVLTVQGPPGTGKSQTIANLVCHLVTEGHSVLVTSHQRKAMEVLSKMLNEFEGLALSMLSGDQESLQKLRTQLEGIQDKPPDHLTEDSVKRGELKLLENDRELRRLQRRFMELKRLEHEEFPSFARYEDLRESDRLSVHDEPIEGSADEVAHWIREWADHYRSLHKSLHSFEAVFRPTGDATSRVREAEIAQTLSRLIEAAETLDDPIGESARAIGERLVGSPSPDGTELLARIRSWVQGESVELVRNLGDLGQDPDRAETLRAWHDVLRRVSRERIGTWRESVDRIESTFKRSPLQGNEYDWNVIEADRVRIRRTADILAERGRSFFWWHLAPVARRSQRWLSERGFEIARAGLDRSLNDVADALLWAEAFDEAQAQTSELAELLPLGGRAAPLQRSRESILRALRDSRAAIGVLGQMDRAPGKDFMAVFQSMEPMYEIGDARCQNALIAELDDVERWLTRSQLTRGLLEALELPEPWSGRAHVVATSVLTGALGPEEAGALDRLKILISYYPRFRRLLDLQGVELRRVANTLEELRGEIQATGEVPAWLSHAETSIEAHRLSSLVRGSLGVHPDSLSEIAGALTQGQDRRRAAISEIVRRKRRLATHDAFQVPSIRTPLLALRKLLRRKRLNDSLIALRNSIDYDAVLRVFPCWIATIDDATRLFPPKSGLFDYMIVDEASQCGQATAMPLAFRAKRMIVVGDKKQLQPVSSMFLAESTVQLLQEEHGLHTHPKAHFLDGKDSLLALAEACSNASRFLDEHFRCDPAIIRWSNHRFYDDRLQILTRRRPDRALIPLEVRELKGPDEDRDDKVNREEAAAVVAAIRRLVSSGEAKHKTIGVISPFRAQAELIQLLLIREFHPDPELLKQHEIVASTADGFQGDERDIILFSFRQGPSSHAGSVTTIQRAEERLNVAFTRARQRAICFVSIPVHHFPAGAIRDFLEHAVSEQNRSTRWDVEGDRPDDFESQFEEAVCKRLRDRALRVTTQVPCGRYRIDLVVEDSEGRQLAVECDGEWKLDALGQLRPEDYQRQDIIERAGWAVHRISGRKWLLNPEREIDLTLEALGRQPTRATLDRFADSSGEPRAGPIIDPLVDDEGPGAAGAPVTRVPPPPPRPSAIAERPLSGSDEAEGEAPTDSRILLAHELIHWNILRSPPEWPVVETLQDIHGSLVRKAAITALQTELLQEAYKMARNAGFQPSPVARPEA